MELLKLARAAGTRVSLGTDAHHPWQLAFIEFGLAAAWQAKLPPERVVNFMSWQKSGGGFQDCDASLRRPPKVDPSDGNQTEAAPAF